MLNLYYGRESLDKEAFLFSKIKEDLESIRCRRSKAERILLIVPAQFTLKAEEAAFSHIDAKGFFDLHIMSGNRLRHRIFGEMGQTGRIAVNTLGRAMLLRKIARDKKGDLGAFRDVADTSEFLSMAGDFIVQLKQNNLSPEGLEEIATQTKEDGILRKKLADMQLIYEAYQQAMEGKFTDSEDELQAVCVKVKKSDFIRSSQIWYYGFYSFTPREIDFMGELMSRAVDLNVVITQGEPRDPDAELFTPAAKSVKALTDRAERLGVPHRTSPVGQEFVRAQRPAELAHIEKELYAVPCRPAGTPADKALRPVRASNPYTESETIAAEILSLVRDQGYSYDDIAVLTNDMQTLGSVLKRIFSLYDIPCFLDEKRTVLHHPLVEVVTSLLDIVSDNFRAVDVLSFLKSGLIPLTCAGGKEEREPADLEEFENYVLQYHIKKERFLQPFRYGTKVFGEEGLRRLEEIRRQLADLLLPFQKSFSGAASIKEKTAVFYAFLADTLQLPRQLSDQALLLAQSGMTDAAEETQQMWKVVLDVMDQAVELIGEETVETGEYRDIFRASLEDIKVGLLPQSAHKVLLGTVGRSHVPNVRALFLAGVNDGVLPSGAGREGLLTDKELSALEEKGYTLSKSQTVKQEEERMVIYKAFTTPSELLYVSYSVADIEGKSIRPSWLILQLRSMFPHMEEQPDIENRESQLELIQNSRSTAIHMTSLLRRLISGEEKQLPALWRQSYNILLELEDKRLAAIRKGLFFTNSLEPLPEKVTRELFQRRDDKEFSFSPSRLERFAKCPFMHYISYGLRPQEKKYFEISGGEIGDLYHRCLMLFSRNLSGEAEKAGIRTTDDRSPWMCISREECDRRIRDILASIIDEDFDGLLRAGKAEEYRTKRVAKVVGEFAWKMVQHVRKGTIDAMLCEAEFGRGQGSALPPVEILLQGKKIFIEGKIDRVDILKPVEGMEHIKIIDYKSGRAELKKDQIEKGLSLQLMLYMEGAVGAKENARPAGIFYYHIDDPGLDVNFRELTADIVSGDILNQMEQKYRMDGIFVDHPAVIQSMDKSLSEGESSTVLSVKKSSEGYSSSKSMGSEEFEAFRKTFRVALSDLCDRLILGSIDIAPRRTGSSTTACTYCDYKSICIFDPAFPGCHYH
jgi:ATP-dependent helicase/nuclease subunit B